MTLEFSSPRWSAADHSMIDLTVEHPVHGTIPYTATAGSYVFERALKGEFGEIAPFVRKVLAGESVRPTITALAERRVGDALRGKRASILSYGLRLWAHPSPLTDEEHLDLTRIVELDQWEEVIIETREALIAAGDVDGARRPSTWPEPPVWLTADWLAEF